MLSPSPNFADASRYLVGSDTLKLTPFYLKDFQIPGVSLSHPELSNRSGTKLHVSADSITFDNLDLNVIIDSEFLTYFELLDWITNTVNVPLGRFSNETDFNLWVRVMDDKYNLRFRLDFHNCRINSLGGINLSPDTEVGFTVPVNISYDYFTYCNQPGTLRSQKQTKEESNVLQH